jgi:hypothetical protein
MGLVRCTCVTTFRPTDDPKRISLEVIVYDPQCDYVIHRLEAS